jgi:hypothetical protein
VTDRAERIYSKLRAAASQGQFHGGVTGASRDQGGRETPDGQNEVDDRAFGHAATFVDTPGGQMQMHAGGDVMPRAVERNMDGQPVGVESEPYMTRPTPQGKQLPLGRAGAFEPRDSALHALRLSNPHLNDYRFRLNANPEGYHAVDAIHVPSGSHAGRLDWISKNYAERTGGTPGEVNMIDVKDQHRGRGLATAMWDFAHLHATRQDSTMNGPVHSEIRSIEGNHWAHFVGGATMPRTGGFGVQRYGEGI